MTRLPDDLRSLLPPDTATTWERIAPHVPTSAYLVGGTAITTYLHHRVSRDLDFFLNADTDLDALAHTLAGLGPFAITARGTGTLNGVFSATKVQFLAAHELTPLAKDFTVAGLRIASLRDLLALKIQVIGGRGELRDYFDLMAIEHAQRGTVEDGLGDYLAKFSPVDPGSSLLRIIEALGFLDDVDEDDSLPASKAEIDAYWRRRQPAILRAAGRL